MELTIDQINQLPTFQKLSKLLNKSITTDELRNIDEHLKEHFLDPNFRFKVYGRLVKLVNPSLSPVENFKNIFQTIKDKAEFQLNLSLSTEKPQDNKELNKCINELATYYSNEHLNNKLDTVKEAILTSLFEDLKSTINERYSHFNAEISTKPITIQEAVGKNDIVYILKEFHCLEVNDKDTGKNYFELIEDEQEQTNPRDFIDRFINCIEELDHKHNLLINFKESERLANNGNYFDESVCIETKKNKFKL